MLTKKILMAGVAAGIVMFVIGYLAGMVAGTWYGETPQLWKPMEGTWFYIAAAFDIVIGIVFAKIYSMIEKGLPYAGMKKSLRYGLILWLIGSIPGMGMTYLTMAVPDKLILAWTVTALVQYMAVAMTIHKIYDKK